MQQRENSEAQGKNERKNQKNIYVHKIKSLMRVSQDTLLQDQKDMSVALNKKQIKKVRSSVDKTAIKLEKNRQSAKRARLRKKLYIKLLQKRVQKLREAADQGTRIESDCLKFLHMISTKQGTKQKEDKLGEDVERYLESQNSSKYPRDQEEKETKLARMDKLVEEICQVSMCSSLRNIRQLSSQISLQEIIKAQNEEERQLQGQELQQIIQEVLMETEHLRNLYVDLMKQNDTVKKIAREMNQKRLQSMHFKHENGDVYGERSEQRKRFDNFVNDFSSCFEKKGKVSKIFINLTEGEKILIEGESYLQQIINETDEN